MHTEIILIVFLLTLFLLIILNGLVTYLLSQNILEIEDRLKHTHKWINCLEIEVDKFTDQLGKDIKGIISISEDLKNNQSKILKK